ncbi:hypothetical protein GA0061078_0675 [Bifidobacterium bohemicum]|uniref:Uncharacterized protein n=1 Tax=Bifidobacterium bohemicum DSM 22767 TaxID=1437606 RepID=A0A086ZK70_9BIFI|nr:hypothetical protein BBOH_0394 [Bifidobacterium bohemicum DSM 22767]SCB85026.1 hypothetical protein GA0061078_0675 [Bifidobacterium bohemicum]
MLMSAVSIPLPIDLCCSWCFYDDAVLFEGFRNFNFWSAVWVGIKKAGVIIAPDAPKRSIAHVNTIKSCVCNP